MIQQLLDDIMDLNINGAVYTTYDRGVADSVRMEIVRKLAAKHGIEYHPHLRPSQVFCHPSQERPDNAKNP
jgi:hypothetical protein